MSDLWILWGVGRDRDGGEEVKISNSSKKQQTNTRADKKNPVSLACERE